MPRNRKPRKKSAKISLKIEQQIVEISLQHPECGARRLMPLLKKAKITVSASTVYRILKRHQLQTRALRFLEVESQLADDIHPPAAVPVSLPPIAVVSPLPPEIPAAPLPREIPAVPIPRAKPVKHRRFLFYPVYLLLLVMIGYLGFQAYQNIQLVRGQQDAAAAVDAAPIPVPEKSEVAVQALEDYRSIWERDLFNLAEDPSLQPKNEIPTDPIALASEDLGLELVGTVVSDDPNLSIAIVDNHKTKDQETYYEGDRAGAVQIKKILRSKVIITTDKGDELLMIDVKQSAKSKDAMPLQLPTSADLVAAAEQLDPDQPVAIRRRTFNLKREDVEKSLSDLAGLMEQLNIAPNSTDDQPAGFKISNIPVRSILRRMGLRNRDVITAVNDQPITGPEQAAEFFAKLTEGGDIRIDIKRRNRNRELNLKIE